MKAPTGSHIVQHCGMVLFESSNAEIASVDLGKESCTTCVGPWSFFSNWEEITVVMLHDKPSLFCAVNHKKQKWSKARAILAITEKMSKYAHFQGYNYCFNRK